MIGPYDEIVRLNSLTGGALIETAILDFKLLAEGLINASLGGSPEDVAAARHALTGICRIMGANRLEAAAHRALQSEADQAAFRACLAATLAQMAQLSAHIERSVPHACDG